MLKRQSGQKMYSAQIGRAMFGDLGERKRHNIVRAMSRLRKYSIDGLKWERVRRVHGKPMIYYWWEAGG